MTHGNSASVSDSVLCVPPTSKKNLINARVGQKSSAHRTQQSPKDASTKSLERFEAPLRQNRADVYNRSFKCCLLRKVISCVRRRSRRTSQPEVDIPDAVKCLTFSEGPLESSTRKMEPEKEQKALKMFDRLNEWIQLSNSEADSVRRDLKFKDIIQATEEFPELKNELFLQLVKQSNGDRDVKRNMNLWKLFSQLVDEMKCPEVLAGHVTDYTNGVAENHTEVPYIRQVAWELSFSVAGKEMSSHELVCPGLKACEVKLVDGESVQVYYDGLMSISQCIAQVAWGLGLPTRPFQLFRRGAGRDEMLDRKGSLSFALGERKGEIVMKVEAFRKSFEEYHGNTAYLRLAYLQCKQLYLEGSYPVSAEKAIELCALTSLSDDKLRDDGVSGVSKDLIINSIPKGLQDILTEVDGVEVKLPECKTADDARRLFISEVGQLRFGHSILFGPVEVIKPVVPGPGNFKVGVNADGVYLYQGTLDQNVETIPTSSITSVKCINHVLQFKFLAGKEERRMHLLSSETPVICKLIAGHIKDLRSKKCEHSAEHKR